MGALALTLPLTVWALKNSGKTSSEEKHLQASSKQTDITLVLYKVCNWVRAEVFLELS